MCVLCCVVLCCVVLCCVVLCCVVWCGVVWCGVVLCCVVLCCVVCVCVFVVLSVKRRMVFSVPLVLAARNAGLGKRHIQGRNPGAVECSYRVKGLFRPVMELEVPPARRRAFMGVDWCFGRLTFEPRATSTTQYRRGQKHLKETCLLNTVDCTWLAQLLALAFKRKRAIRAQSMLESIYL